MATKSKTAARRRITIRDVARESGVALSTVSNALNGKTYVLESTRKIVQETAKRLGYRASPVAQALRAGRSMIVGVLVADVANPSYPDFIRGIEDVASSEGCTLMLFNTDGNEAKQIRQMQELIDRRADGMVLLSPYCESAPVRRLLDGSGVPFVLVQRRSAKFRDNFVGADDNASITRAVEYLASLGHRRIGYIRGPAESSAVRDRLAAFKSVIQRLALDRTPELIFPGDYGTEAGYKAAGALLELARPPTAIMASNDMNALGVLDAAMERGILVPRQLSVVGYDDIALARLRRIDLTTISLPKREMGAAAAKLLLELVAANGQLPPRDIIFGTHLVVRGTSGPASKPAAASRNRKQR